MIRYEKTLNGIEFKVDITDLSASDYMIEISSVKRLQNKEETVFVKARLNLDQITNFYADKHCYKKHSRVRIGDHSPQTSFKLTKSQFFESPKYDSHRQIYQEAKQMLKEELAKQQS